LFQHDRLSAQLRKSIGCDEAGEATAENYYIGRDRGGLFGILVIRRHARKIP
jgi:hypothetical protein